MHTFEAVDVTRRVASDWFSRRLPEVLRNVMAACVCVLGRARTGLINGLAEGPPAHSLVENTHFVLVHSLGVLPRIYLPRGRTACFQRGSAPGVPPRARCSIPSYHAYAVSNKWKRLDPIFSSEEAHPPTLDSKIDPLVSSEKAHPPPLGSQIDPLAANLSSSGSTSWSAAAFLASSLLEQNSRRWRRATRYVR
eukprot:1193763-Prorocentrum_minimum.AAC.4